MIVCVPVVNYLFCFYEFDSFVASLILSPNVAIERNATAALNFGLPISFKLSSSPAFVLPIAPAHR